MDREQHFKSDAPILPSRHPALAAMSAAHERGPILITGEPGIGKTWLARRFGLLAPRTPRWLEVDLAPSTEPADLYRSIAHGLSLDYKKEKARELRFKVARVLAEEATEGRRWGLVVDEAQIASDDLLEEIRILSNRLGRPDGFATIVILGQTPLSRRIDRRALAALDARLSARIHLQPIDADEAKLLLDHAIGAGAFDSEQVDDLHRASSGNPQRLLGMAAATLGARVALGRPSPSDARRTSNPAILPSRPPLRVEEGMIEVGWDSEPDAAPAAASTSAVAPAASRPMDPSSIGDHASEPAQSTLPADEPITDHYAALQAWNEWAENHGRGPSIESSDPSSVLDLGQERESPASSVSPIGDHPQVWAEGQQGFAPYSQLFSRLRPHRDHD